MKPETCRPRTPKLRGLSSQDYPVQLEQSMHQSLLRSRVFAHQLIELGGQCYHLALFVSIDPRCQRCVKLAGRKACATLVVSVGMTQD